jgi:2-amino-4-hydroxy-6-hydroxymethyldihydropteridine diphosphokinase
MPNLVYLSLGSNVGDREKNLREAVRRLGSVGRVQAISSAYETEPVEFTDQPWFLNCAVVFESSSTPAQLMPQLLEIRTGHGSARLQKKGPQHRYRHSVIRDEVVNTVALTIPTRPCNTVASS